MARKLSSAQVAAQTHILPDMWDCVVLPGEGSRRESLPRSGSAREAPLSARGTARAGRRTLGAEGSPQRPVASARRGLAASLAAAAPEASPMGTEAVLELWREAQRAAPARLPHKCMYVCI